MVKSTKGKEKALPARSSSLPPDALPNTPTLLPSPPPTPPVDSPSETPVKTQEAPLPTPSASPAGPPQLTSNAESTTPAKVAEAPKRDNNRATSARPQTSPVPTGQPTQKDAVIRRAFLYQQTAAYFLSVYGRNIGLTARVHEIGSLFDSIVTARQVYLDLVE